VVSKCFLWFKKETKIQGMIKIFISNYSMLIRWVTIGTGFAREILGGGFGAQLGAIDARTYNQEARQDREILSGLIFRTD
jgi:hypothetical protein